jgi:hypothetical protein
MVVSRLAIVSVGAAFEPMSPRTKASAQSRPPPSRCSASSSGSRSRVHWSVFDTKRSLVVQEANAIGTAYLRLDLAPAPDQPALRQLFRQYLDARIRVFATPQDDVATDRAVAAAETVQRRIWSAVMESAGRDPSQNVARMLAPAINEMIDITTVRRGVVERDDGRVRDGQARAPQRPPRSGVRHVDRHDDLCGTRPRASAARADSPRRH